MEKIKLLVLDDELEILKALKRLLQKHYEVETFSSGEDALRALQHQQYPVIISDMRMPKMDGAEFLSTAHKLAPASQKILLTGFSDPVDTMRAVNQGHINFYVTKPWQNDKLLQVIGEAIDNYVSEIKRRSAFNSIQSKNQQLRKNTSELEIDLLEHETALNKAEHKNEIALSKIKQTLQRSVDVMGHCIELNEMHLQGHGERVCSQVRLLGKQFKFPAVMVSHLCIAAKLYRLGLISLAATTSHTVFNELSSRQQAETLDALMISCELLNPFLELAPAVDIIQLMHVLAKTPNKVTDNLDPITLKCAHMVYICSQLDLLMAGHINGKYLTFDEAVMYLQNHHHYLEKSIFSAIINYRGQLLNQRVKHIELAVVADELVTGMIISQSIILQNSNHHYLEANHQLTEENIQALQKIESNLASPLVVFVKFS